MKIDRMAADQKDDFAQIWIPWLIAMGRVPEPEDLEIMRDPAAYYRNSGGEVFLATDGEELVGAVAVKGLGASGHEFCKLVVTESARGRGAGRALVQSCVEYSISAGGPALYLQSFRALDVALGLYQRMGFCDTPPPVEMIVLQRTQIIMAISTKPAG